MRRSAHLFAAALAPLLALTSCGLDSADDSGAATAEGFPITIDNCDHEVTVKAPPQRVASLNQGTTEVLLSLGLADRMVGTSDWTDPILPSLEAENARVDRLTDGKPAFEVVLDKEPDFVTASFISHLSEGGVASREQFEELGVGTYIAPSSCDGKSVISSDGARDEPFELALVHKEIRELAKLFAVEDKGEELISSLEQKVADASEVDATGTTALFWFANSESPYMAGCCGAPGLIARELGLENVFDDASDEWPQINWETVAERNPDVLIIGDLTRKSQTAETAEAKIAFLESNPVTREMDAVKNKRYIRVTGAEMNPSLRTVYGIENVAAGLRELGLAD
ncbi:ABC transporter substrate-binding protein [Nocardioides alcanivorans]|uniref:ABC transporter substrate-binding protein n=1 Tax=Nocardioides alcanivorans TaxID=2897352 RepID=UPI001F2D3D90|nr:ABC transporter substrate-binding protein [Nocardioides alcanivorans]